MKTPASPASLSVHRQGANRTVTLSQALRLFVLTIVLMWLAHALAFFVHEYSHSTMAWILGWKRNPLDLHFSDISAKVILIQLGINQNVNNAPIFASGHGPQAAIIAAAGAVLGNGFITYPLGLLLLHMGLKRANLPLALFAFWLVTASVGNFVDYVPIRTFTGGEDDMGILATGFGWSPWLVLAVLGVPTLIATANFLWTLAPSTVTRLYPDAPLWSYFTAILGVLALFCFYGSAGFLEGDRTSFRMSLLSVFAAAPIATLIAVVRVHHFRARRLDIG